MRSVLSRLNTNLRQTLTLSLSSILLHFCVLFHFSFFRSQWLAPQSAFRVLVKVLWYIYLLYERDSVNLEKVISEIAMLWKEHFRIYFSAEKGWNYGTSIVYILIAWALVVFGNKTTSDVSELSKIIGPAKRQVVFWAILKYHKPVLMSIIPQRACWPCLLPFESMRWNSLYVNGRAYIRWRV